jgi:acetyltransferase-like isoleucine patch superfamily enzyme
MIGVLRRLWAASWYDKIGMLVSAYYILKGIIFYRLCFRQFGAGSQLRKPLLIHCPQFISIGNGVSIREGVRLEVIQSNPARVPDLRIGDGTNIEQNVHIVCHSRLHIGRNVSITGQCAIVDVTHPYQDVHLATKIGARIANDDSFVEIGDNCFLGIGTVVLPNVRIGKHVITGARSVITRDVADYSVVAGAPARIVSRYDFAREAWVGAMELEVSEGK